ncbi:MAG TPA: DUF3562 domain-containing protein [Casimicrobiaceae bacterium]|nr:DUF3562 domain-containing protein [Casimicrobiaceae bacterium]
MLGHDNDEEDNHDDVIANIAQEMHFPLPVVKRVFEAELSRLMAAARITDYVVLFASRRTRAELLAGQRRASAVS